MNKEERLALLKAACDLTVATLAVSVFPGERTQQIAQRRQLFAKWMETVHTEYGRLVALHDAGEGTKPT